MESGEQLAKYGWEIRVCRPSFSGSICNFWLKIKSDFGCSLTTYWLIIGYLLVNDLLFIARAAGFEIS